jgi:hypothetical protein
LKPFINQRLFGSDKFYRTNPINSCCSFKELLWDTFTCLLEMTVHTIHLDMKIMKTLILKRQMWIKTPFLFIMSMFALSTYSCEKVNLEEQLSANASFMNALKQSGNSILYYGAESFRMVSGEPVVAEMKSENENFEGNYYQLKKIDGMWGFYYSDGVYGTLYLSQSDNRLTGRLDPYFWLDDQLVLSVSKVEKDSVFIILDNGRSHIGTIDESGEFMSGDTFITETNDKAWTWYAIKNDRIVIPDEF